MAKREDFTAGDRIELDMGFKMDALDADIPDGYIKGIASTSITDSYGHKVMSGAFDDSILSKFDLKSKEYFLVVGRNVPENNFQMRGH